MGSEQAPDCGSDSDPNAERGDSGAETGASSASGSPNASDEMPVDTLFETLSRPGNRYILSYVIQEEGPVPYNDLVEYVVDKAETPMDLSKAEFRGRIATRLIHANLPKLEDAGLIDYDTSAQVIRSTPATDVAVPYLELAMEQSLDT